MDKEKEFLWDLICCGSSCRDCEFRLPERDCEEIIKETSLGSLVEIYLKFCQEDRSQKLKITMGSGDYKWDAVKYITRIK